MINWIATFEDILRHLDKENQIRSLKEMYQRVQFECLRIVRDMKRDEIIQSLTMDGLDECAIKSFYEDTDFSNYELVECPHCDAIALDLGESMHKYDNIHVCVCLNGHVFSNAYDVG